jgi:hypothetical protein
MGMLNSSFSAIVQAPAASEQKPGNSWISLMRRGGT